VASAAAMPAATTMCGEAAMPAEAAVAAEAAMATLAAVPGESWVPMRKAVTPPAMIKVAMTPAAEPAIDVYVGAVYVRAVTSGRVTNGLRASGQAKTDADQ
jgi:hypothetical protein